MVKAIDKTSGVISGSKLHAVTFKQDMTEAPNER